MPLSGTNTFSFDLVGGRHWRIALTSSARRDVICTAAAKLSSEFYPTPTELSYQRRKPHLQNVKQGFEAPVDALLQHPAAPLAGGLARIDDACVIAGRVLTSARGEVVEESLANLEHFARLGPFRRGPNNKWNVALPALLPMRRHTGEYIFLRQIWDGNYGHWLVEGLPRVAVAAQFCDLKRCKLVIPKHRRAPGLSRVYRDSLDLIGIGQSQIMEIGRWPTQFETLHYPLPTTKHPYIKSPAAIAFLETLPNRLKSPRPGPEKVFVTRNSAKSRHLSNENQVWSLLEPLGFVRVEPGRMSFEDQIRAFSGARIIIGNCGAELTNMVFAPRGVSVFALTTPFMADDFFWDLTDIKQGNFFSLHGEADEPALGAASAMRIDVPTFKSMLREFLGGV